MPTDEYKVVIRADKRPQGEHERRFNAPTMNDVAIVMVGEHFDKRDIILQKRDDALQRICETHRSYDALQYPIIFWGGEDGYHFNYLQINPQTGLATNKKISATDFYAYKIMLRSASTNHILKCRQLFQQFVVDMYAKVESERLLYVRINQQKLRVDDYIHLRDAIANDGNAGDIGQRVILPATFTGSPRHMHEYAQDAMSYVRTYGRPDLFVTFTCNPTWTEIKEELFCGETPSDRHDLTARVFKQKLGKLMEVINKHHIFGETRCWLYTVEWQKRGLPHAHILIWLKDKIRSTQIDSVISAEFPNPEQDPILFEIISKNMIHGPCGQINQNSPCMKDGKCTKMYPREMLRETQTGNDGYPLYRRRKPEDGGFTARIRLRDGNRLMEVDVDNRWVVPFCPLLSKMFKAHINVECCNSVKCVKYICKYVNKGSDMAVFQLAHNTSPVDEIAQFQMGRYISSNEAVWRLLNFAIHERHPTVVHLSVHLENGQRVYFTTENAQVRAQHPPRTTLMGFFLLCQHDEFARTLYYNEVPKFYTWNQPKNEFCKRKKGSIVPGFDGRASDALGRVYTVHPNNAECFYLRLLLHNVRGPVSFAAIRTVNGVICQTYREACQKLGLLEDDQHWDMTLSEATYTHLAPQLRSLFAIIITTCAPSNPFDLWEKYKESLTEDILRQQRAANPTLEITNCPNIYNHVLILIEEKCRNINGKSLEQLGLPSPCREEASIIERDMSNERSYDVEEQQTYIERNIPLLVNDQMLAYNAIMTLITGPTGGLIFLDAPGGTGKTFLINIMLAKIRSQNEIALAIASSGIAATLLDGGRTAHSALKLPLNLTLSETPVCNIPKGSAKAKILKECKIIVWDECTMAHKRALEALNRTLQDIRGNTALMGGAVVVLAGDFRQTLPVIPKGTPADELNACLKASTLWRHVQKFTLTTNMRVHLEGDTTAQQFSNQLLQLGNGEFCADRTTGLISFPNNFCVVVSSLEEIIEKVFPNMTTNISNPEWLYERAILAPRNDTVNNINNLIQNVVPGFSKLYISIDTVMEEDQAVNFPTEFLNSLELPGMPPHKLTLKVGTPIILLRNMDPPKLCNGTRLFVNRLLPNVIEATILTKAGAGDSVFIPRIPLISTDMPFEFKRLQFPVRPAFAMTINKSQGQTLKVVGVNLSSPCFSHGQLYVACSRVGSPANLFIYVPDGKTRNIVYRKALE